MNSPDQTHVWQNLQKHGPTPALMIGAVISLVLAIYVLVGGPGAVFVTWIALVPVMIGGLLHILKVQCAVLSAPVKEIETELQLTADELRNSNDQLIQQVQDLINLRDVMLATGATFDRGAILDEVNSVLTDMLRFDRGLVLLFDEKNNALTFGAYSHAAPDPESQFLLEQLRLDLDDAEQEPLLGRWLAGKSILVEETEPYMASRLNWLLTTLNLRLFYSVPLKVGDQFKGVIIVDNTLTHLPITTEQRSMLDALAAHIAITLENARLYQHTDERLNSKVQEMEVLARIDRELNHTLSVERVINLTLDWALRFTPSHVATVAMVDQNGGTMRFVAGYGYVPAQWEQIAQQVWSLEKGIAGRAARTRQTINVADVTQDPDYYSVVPDIQSHLSVPITREDRVIAVLSLESKDPDAFDDETGEFVRRVVVRAAAALDNANLLQETQRERQKLAIILSNITDAVIVTDHEHKLVMVNPAAMASFHLPPKENYIGRTFNDVFMNSALLPLYRRARDEEHGLAEELPLSDKRTVHVSIVPVPQVGWSIVAHDITHFKETEKLKNELLATTSHDLKNPLSTIMGYADLIGMTNTLNPQGLEYMRRVQGAVKHMRQLIDDLLDMARIESGIRLNYNYLQFRAVIENVLASFTPQIGEKHMHIDVKIPSDLPHVPADEARISQVFNNLISNAIKYTPAGGHIQISAEAIDGQVRITVKDDGLGISPEDQAQVFARFYRVRTVETDSIDGTGLGLAIARSLVEMHGGQIGLRSHLGEGSTFFVTLPLVPPAPKEDTSEHDRLVSDAGAQP